MTNDNGPLVKNVTGSQYYTLLFKNIKIKVKQEKNSFILTKKKEIVKCLNFCKRGDDILLNRT